MDATIQETPPELASSPQEDEAGFIGVSEQDTGSAEDSDAPESEAEEPDFTDISEDGPNLAETGEESEGQEADSSRESAGTEAPSAETLSLHVHRTLSTGRAILSVITSNTDPYYRIEASLNDLADALPLLLQLYEEAAAYWKSQPRYPELADQKPEQPTRAVPRTKPKADSSKPQKTEQASLL